MTAKYWQKGEVLDYKASAAVKNGEVVSLGTRIGVAGEDIATGAMTMGAAVYYDEAAKKITTVASTGESSSKVNNIPAGYAAAPAASADENVLVKLLG